MKTNIKKLFTENSIYVITTLINIAVIWCIYKVFAKAQTKRAELEEMAMASQGFMNFLSIIIMPMTVWLIIIFSYETVKSRKLKYLEVGCSVMMCLSSITCIGINIFVQDKIHKMDLMAILFTTWFISTMVRFCLFALKKPYKTYKKIK